MIYIRHCTAIPRAMVSPFLISAKKTHLGRGATTLQTLGKSESDEARIEGTKRLRFEGEARIEGEFFLDPSNPHPFSGLSPKKGRGFPGGGSASPSPEQFSEFRTSNRSISCILELEILKNRLFKENLEKHSRRTS